MNVHSDMQYILFYRPPCGKWYVHSHKLYPSVEAAYEGAKKFLEPSVPVAVLSVTPAFLDMKIIRVGEIS